MRGTAQKTPIGSSAARSGRAGLTLKETVRTKAFWLLALAFAFSNFGTTPAFVLLVPALTRSGISTELAAVAAAAIPLASLPGRMVIGFGGDYVDKRKLVALCLGLQAAGLMLLAGAGSVPLLAIFVIVFGTGFGGPIPLRTAIQAELFGLTSLGSIQGMVTLATTLGGLFGPIVAGGLVDVTGNYQAAFLVCAAIAALGIPLIMAVPRPGGVSNALTNSPTC